jgi:hypothetical protein
LPCDGADIVFWLRVHSILSFLDIIGGISPRMALMSRIFRLAGGRVRILTGAFHFLG